MSEDQEAGNGSPKERKVKTKPSLTEKEINQLSSQARQFVREHLPIIIPIPELGEGFSVQSDYQPRTLREGRERIPPELGRRFDAHGIAKGGERDQLRALNRLLSQGIDPSREFHTMELRSDDEASASAMGAAGPYDEGGFIVIGHPDTLIRETGIAGVLVNEHFELALPVLRERFSDIEFIKGSDLPQGLQKAFFT